MNPSFAFQFSNFGSQPQQRQLQQMPGLVDAPHIYLQSTEGTPLWYRAKWSDIHDDTKNLLLAIEEQMLEYRDESRRLDHCSRLYDSAALHKGFDLESVSISQELRGVGEAIVTEESSLREMVHAAKVLIRNAEVAVRSCMMLRNHVSRLKAPAGSTLSTGPLAQGFSNTPSANRQAEPPRGPTPDFYCGVPSQFLQHTVSRFEGQMSEYVQRTEGLERLLQDGNGSQDNGRRTSEMSLLQSLPTVMTNLHSVFIHVAAEVESLHQKIEAMRTAYIADRRRKGDDINPFLEADQREVAKREVAAKRVHPTLHGSMTQLAKHMSGMDPHTQLLMPFETPGSVQSIPSSRPLFGAQETPGLFPPPSAAAQFTPSMIASIFGSGNPTTPTGSALASNRFDAGTATSLFGKSSATPDTFGQNLCSTPMQKGRAWRARTLLSSMSDIPTGMTPLFDTAQTPLFGTPDAGTQFGRYSYHMGEFQPSPRSLQLD